MFHSKTSGFSLIPITASIAILAVAVPGIAANDSTPVMSDENVATAVHEELRFDSLVPAAELSVSARDGTVVLRGETRNLLARERAERIAETVKGVREVQNEIVVKPGIRRGPTETRRLVLLNLQQDPVVEAHDIGVDVSSDGDVTLTGSVDSWTERLFVENAAERVVGVRSVNNEIRLDIRTERFDNDVQADVEGKLRWDAYIDARGIDVSVTSGQVRLSGTVGSAAEKRRAASIAWGPGVTSVSADALQVVPAQGSPAQQRAASVNSRAQEDLESVITAKFALNPRLWGEDIEVDVANGIVALRGSVADLRARRAASAVARATAGVEEVQNRLVVRPLPKPPTDVELRDAIQNALRRDAMTAEAEIQVSADDGDAELRGTVSSMLVRLAAEEVAGGVRGVDEVENHLVVEPRSPAYHVDPYLDDGSALAGLDPPPGDTRGILTASRPDPLIEQSIQNQFWWSPFVDENDVEVSVDQGVATLEGVVGTRAEILAALENAREGGAIAVVNRLQIAD